MKHARIATYGLVVLFLALVALHTRVEGGLARVSLFETGEVSTLLDLQRNEGGRDFAGIVRAWGSEAAHARWSLLLDFVFIPVYALLFLRLSARRRAGGSSRFRRLFVAALVLAALADAAENVALWVGIGRASVPGAALELVAAVARHAGGVKFCALAAALLLWMRPLTRTLQYLFAARVSLVGALLLLAAPRVMIGSSLLGNTLLVENWRQLVSTGFLTGLAAIAVTATASLTVRYAPERFRVSALSDLRFHRPDGVPFVFLWEGILALLLATPFVGFVSLDPGIDRPSVSWLGFVPTWLGALGGVALVFFLKNGIHRMRAAWGFPRLLPRGVSFRGYVRKGVIRPGHLPLITSNFIYLAVFAYLSRLEPEDVGEVPVVAMLTFLIGFQVLSLAGLAFLLDRARIPLALALITVTVVAGLVTKSTHYYFPTLRDASSHEEEVDRESGLARPGELVQALPTEGGVRRAVLICAEGGGIQAAAWTALVLTELDEVESIRSRMQLVSGVSGGSVGALHYLEALYQHGGRLEDADREQVRAAARRSSLQAVAWALVFKDTLRMIGLGDLAMDRGIALERALSMHHAGSSSGAASTLDGWAQAVRAGRMPASVFNATFAGIGDRPDKAKRFVLGTVALEHDGPLGGARARGFFDLYPDLDLSVATAARLSASFPYVTPLARPSFPAATERRWPIHYVADGGYFDNLGFVTALDWLESVAQSGAVEGDATDESAPRLAGIEVAIAVVRGFPITLVEPPLEPGSREWKNATIGPLDLLLGTWNRTQLVRMDVERALLRRAFGRQVELFQFDPTPPLDGTREPPPLSWHLSKAQQDWVERAWSAEQERERDELASWLRTGVRE